MKTNCTLLLILFAFGLKAQVKKFGVALMASNPIYDYKVGYFDIDMESIDNSGLTWKSYNIGTQFYFNINEQTTYRLRFGYTKINVKEYSEEYIRGSRIINTAYGIQNKFQIAPAVVWNFNQRKLSIYAGFELPFTSHGVFDLKTNFFQTDSISGVIIYNENDFVKIPKGFSVGIGALFGFNYNLNNNFSIGAEFSPALLYAKTGGKVETSDFYLYTKVSTDYNKGFTYYENRFSICVTYWFSFRPRTLAPKDL